MRYVFWCLFVADPLQVSNLGTLSFLLKPQKVLRLNTFKLIPQVFMLLHLLGSYNLIQITLNKMQALIHLVKIIPVFLLYDYDPVQLHHSLKD